MVDSLAGLLTRTLESGPWLAPLVAFAGGVVTAANPCVLGMVPVAVAYVAGRSEAGSLASSLRLSLAFALGLTLTFTALFALSVGTHGLLGSGVWGYVAAAVCILMGLQMLGLLRLEIPAPSWTPPTSRGVGGALALGMLFGLTSLPCVGPVLLTLLAVLPTIGVASGAVLMAAYGLGHCLLVVAAGTSVGFAQRALTTRRLFRAAAAVRVGGGALAIGAGAYLLLVP